MNIETINKLVEENYSIGKIAKSLSCSPSTVRYWLKKFNLKTKRALKIKIPHCNCDMCGKTINQLQGRNRKTCNYCNVKKKRYKLKLKAIDLLGGKCCRCDYNFHPAAFEFHHIDPSTKRFIIGNSYHMKWENIIEELQKCELLCANCHRIEHSTRFEMNWSLN